MTCRPERSSSNMSFPTQQRVDSANTLAYGVHCCTGENWGQQIVRPNNTGEVDQATPVTHRSSVAEYTFADGVFRLFTNEGAVGV